MAWCTLEVHELNFSADRKQQDKNKGGGGSLNGIKMSNSMNKKLSSFGSNELARKGFQYTINFHHSGTIITVQDRA